MLLVNLFFLPAIFFVGAITAYEDIALSRIRNKWIILSLGYSLFCYLLLYLLAFFKVIDYGGANYRYIISLALNLGISIPVAYGLWKYGVWASGDAKLFIAYSMLIPLDFYAKGYILYFPSAVLLFNIFIPIFLAIVVTTPFKLLGVLVSLLRDPDRLRKAWGSAGQLCKNPAARVKGIFSKNKASVPAYLLIFCGLQYAMRGSHLNSAWIAVILLLSQPLIQIIKKKSKILLWTVIAVLGYLGHRIIYGQGLKEIPVLFWQMFKIFSLFWMLRLLLAAYVKYTQVKKIEISQLQAQMIPSEETLKALQASAQDVQQRIGPVYPDGFSKEQVEAVKGLYMEKGLQTIEVYKTFPFAPWMFLGVIITLIFKQSIFTIAKSLFSLK